MYCRYNRGWFYHRELQLWLIRPQNMEPLVKTAIYERGTYHYFDPNTWDVHLKVSITTVFFFRIYCLTVLIYFELKQHCRKILSSYMTKWRKDQQSPSRHRIAPFNLVDSYFFPLTIAVKCKFL